MFYMKIFMLLRFNIEKIKENFDVCNYINNNMKNLYSMIIIIL